MEYIKKLNDFILVKEKKKVRMEQGKRLLRKDKLNKYTNDDLKNKNSRLTKEEWTKLEFKKLLEKFNTPIKIRKQIAKNRKRELKSRQKEFKVKQNTGKIIAQTKRLEMILKGNLQLLDYIDELKEPEELKKKRKLVITDLTNSEEEDINNYIQKKKKKQKY